MARFSITSFSLVFYLVFFTVNLYASADGFRFRRDMADYFDNEADLTPREIAVLQRILAVPSPSKRQLCSPGYAFNPLIGRCRPSSKLIRQGVRF